MWKVTYLDGSRHGRPVRPQPVLHRPVQVQQEEGHHVQHACLGHGALPPRLERQRRGDLVGGPRRGRSRVVGHGGYGVDLAVEVVLEGLLEGRHYAAELVGGEVGGGLQGSEVRVELCQALEEGLCSKMTGVSAVPIQGAWSKEGQKGVGNGMGVMGSMGAYRAPCESPPRAPYHPGWPRPWGTSYPPHRRGATSQT